MNRDVCEHFVPHGLPCDKCRKCASCANLEVWPKVFGGAKFVCFKTNKLKNNQCSSVYPKVLACDSYVPGKHYSVINLLRNREH
jgi:hypothetical protein